MFYWFSRCMRWHLCWNICTLNKSILWLCPELPQPTKCCPYSRTSSIPSVFPPEWDLLPIFSVSALCSFQVLLEEDETRFSVNLYLWQAKHIAAVFHYCHFALAQLLQLVSDQLGVVCWHNVCCCVFPALGIWDAELGAVSPVLSPNAASSLPALCQIAVCLRCSLKELWGQCPSLLTVRKDGLLKPLSCWMQIKQWLETKISLKQNAKKKCCLFTALPETWWWWSVEKYLASSIS